MKNPALDELLTKVRALRLPRCAEAIADQAANEPEYETMPFTERLSRIIDAEWCGRCDTRTEKLIKRARFSLPQACLENLHQHPQRRFDQLTLQTLKTNSYVYAGHNVIIDGAAGSGKSFLSCALGVNACRAGLTVQYFSASSLSGFLETARTAPPESEPLREVYRADLLILDEFLLHEPDDPQVWQIYQILEKRHGTRATMVCSSWRPEAWHGRLGGGPLADGVMDRICNPAFRLSIESSVSMREIYENVASEDVSLLQSSPARGEDDSGLPAR